MSGTKLSVRGVRKEFGGKVVLDAVSLDVGEHGVVCITRGAAGNTPITGPGSG